MRQQQPQNLQQQQMMQQQMQQEQMMMMGMPDDMIGAIKIKDGLFIGDEFAAQVSIVKVTPCRTWNS